MTKERKRAEQILEKVSKEFGLIITRVKPKPGQSHPGALQGRRDKEVILTVRWDGCLAFKPFIQVVQTGRSHGGEYPYITRLTYDDPNLENAFVNACRDTRLPSEWGNELKTCPF